MLHFLACALTLTLGFANAKQQRYTLKVVDANVNPDGFPRPAVTVDGTFGPLLAAGRYDDFQIEVNNRLSDPRMLKGTSIHWHGIFQHRTAAMDGPAFVTQCPIASGHNFTYEFPTGGQTGTYWQALSQYHSHYSTQYCDGLRGPIVIYDPQDPYLGFYDIDDASTVITFADWYHAFAPVVAARPGPPTPDSTLINGLGRWVGNPTGSLSVVSVKHGKRYRMRLINIACDPNYFITFEGHTLTVIEADGITTKPQVVNSVQLFVGQRYSVILTANRPVANYWIRANPSSGPPGFLGGINSAILRYEGAPASQPIGVTQFLGKTLLEQSLVPQSNPHPPGGHNPPDVDFVFNITSGNHSFFMNGVTYQSPSVPIILQILNGADPRNLLPKGSVYILPKNSVIQISVPGGSLGAPHPFHLHGHSFSVIRSAGQTVYNYDDPVQRDVVSTGGSKTDFTTIRFRTDNPGPWIFHCHIDWHLGAGLAVVFAEDPAGQVKGPQSQKHTKAWDQLCPIWDSLPDSEH
ncbi:laccase precursor [Cantharellus anzutake]|uniref:laccase precursor n=1 Tax=Cantharellus anzutake TaxID=1750568 RepID=UPI0019039143|nr:laccase precursor [Cantharellus anzutake]KAF8335681.1 laccase precursor [Cantharellus anzutake]